jgi:hypothetical protein
MATIPEIEKLAQKILEGSGINLWIIESVLQPSNAAKDFLHSIAKAQDFEYCRLSKSYFVPIQKIDIIAFCYECVLLKDQIEYLEKTQNKSLHCKN